MVTAPLDITSSEAIANCTLGQKDFSLVELGIVDQPSCRLLLVNGTHDGLMPVEDSLLLLERGSPKEARVFTGLSHMGYPLANDSIYPWIEGVMATAS